MKMKMFLLVMSVVCASCVNAQSFFKPLPKPSAALKATATAANPLVQNSFRPVVAISASVSDGTSLASGLGGGFEHLKWDDASQSWITVYSISAIGFLTTNGNSIGGTAGLVFGIPGTGGLISVGPGYDVTGKRWVFLSGVQIQFK